MTLVENEWERRHHDNPHNATLAAGTLGRQGDVRNTSYTEGINFGYFEPLDIVAAALATFMLLAPLTVYAIGAA